MSLHVLPRVTPNNNVMRLFVTVKSHLMPWHALARHRTPFRTLEKIGLNVLQNLQLTGKIMFHCYFFSNQPPYVANCILLVILDMERCN